MAKKRSYLWDSNVKLRTFRFWAPLKIGEFIVIGNKNEAKSFIKPYCRILSQDIQLYGLSLSKRLFKNLLHNGRANALILMPSVDAKLVYDYGAIFLAYAYKPNAPRFA